jgi:hypothetical protein
MVCPHKSFFRKSQTMAFVAMTPASILNRSATPEASLDYGQQIHCVVIWVRMPLFHKWRLTDGILLFLW